MQTITFKYLKAKYKEKIHRQSLKSYKDNLANCPDDEKCKTSTLLRLSL